MVRSRSKASVESFQWLNIDRRLKNAKFSLWLQSYFIRKKTQFLTLLKNFLRMLEFPKSLFQSQSKAWVEPSQLFNINKRLESAKFGQQIKNPFFGKVRQTLKLSKNVLHILEIPLNLFPRSFCQNPKSNLLSHGILVQSFITPNFVDEYRTIFLGNIGWPWNFLKISSLIEVLYKLVLGSVKSLSRIFWVIEYWYKTQECKSWWANTKTIMLAKQRKTWSFSKQFLFISEFSIESPNKLEYSERSNICTRLKNNKFGQRMQNHFSGKTKQTLKLSSNVLPTLKIPINLFWSLSKA